MEKITNIEVRVSTGGDDKEDAQFEILVYQGVSQILHAREGGGQNWEEGDYKELSYDLDVNVAHGEAIRVVCALQDGPWGRNNDWDAYVQVIVGTNLGRTLAFSRGCAFRTGARRRRHELPFGTRRWTQATALVPA